MAKRWRIEWMVVAQGGERCVPAFEFLAEIPRRSREVLLAILDAVSQAGPDQWKDSTTHTAMTGSCSHLHEARDRLDQTLYRLYLCWQRDQHRVVVIGGATKPNDTALPSSFYDKLAASSNGLESDDPPLATVDDITRLTLELADRLSDAEGRAQSAERDLEDLLDK